MGTVRARLDPGIRAFGQFKDLPRAISTRPKHRGSRCFAPAHIRCEKASAILLRGGFAESITSGAHPQISRGVSQAESRCAANVLYSTTVSARPRLRSRLRDRLR